MIEPQKPIKGKIKSQQFFFGEGIADRFLQLTLLFSSARTLKSLRELSVVEEIKTVLQKEIESSLCFNIKCSQIIIQRQFFFYCIIKCDAAFLTFLNCSFLSHTLVLHHSISMLHKQDRLSNFENNFKQKEWIIWKKNREDQFQRPLHWPFPLSWSQKLHKFSFLK